MTKRILFFLGGSYVSGLEIVTLHLMKTLKEKGHEVKCVISGWNDGVWKKKLEEAGIPYVEAKLGWLFLTKPLWTMDSLVHYPRAFLKVRRFIRAFDPDIMHFCSYATVLLLYPLLKKKNCVYNLQEPHEPTSKHLFIYRQLAKKVSIFTAVSTYIERVLVDLQVPPSRIRVVFNGVDKLEGVSGTKIAAPVQFGIIGQVASWKGHDTLVEAVDMLRGTGQPAFRVKIFGNDQNEYAGQLKKKISGKQLDEYFSWEGFVKDQDQIYKNVDGVIVPSLSQEPCSLTIIESMMRGKVLVVSDRGGNPELVDDKETGFIFKADDPRDLADAIRRVLDNGPEVARMGENAHRKAATQYTNLRMTDDYVRFYEEIA